MAKKGKTGMGQLKQDKKTMKTSTKVGIVALILGVAAVVSRTLKGSQK